MKRFVSPYRGKVTLNVLFNLLSTIFSLFSFAAIIPVLQMLFGLTQRVGAYVPLQWSMPLEQLLDAVKNNLFCWIGQQTEAGNAAWVLFWLGLFLVLMTGAKCLCAYLASYYMIPIRTGVLRDLRRSLYEKITVLPIGYFTEKKKGDVISRMTVDVQEVENSMVASLDMLLRDPIMVVIYLFTLFFLSWQLTLFVLLLLPTAGLLIGRIGRNLKKRSTKGQEQTGELLSQIEETLGGLRVVKAFNAEHKLRARFDAQNERTRDTFNRIHRRYALAHPVSEFLGTALIAVLLWYGGGLILAAHSTIDAAEFIYYLVIFYSIINPFKDITKAAYSVKKGSAALDRIDSILCVQDATESSPSRPLALSSSRPLDASVPRVSYDHVSFAYQQDMPVLQDVSFQLQSGQTIAFVGQSGSGKTTLVDMLPRFYDVQEGAIRVDGVDVREMDVHALRARMGVVSQDAILFNDTIWNNITFGVETATEEQVREAARVANALEFIEQTENGFMTIVGDRGCRLSGGQRQRISIARAILKNPEILILDEATSALDTESERLVQEALEHLMQHRTTLVIAHRLSTIRNADIICVMQDGKIVERGTHQQLLAQQGYYARLLAQQA